MHHCRITNVEKDAVILAAGNRDSGHQHVHRLTAGITNPVGKPAAIVNAAAVVGHSAANVPVADGDVAQSIAEQNAATRRTGGGGGNGVAVQIQRHAVGGDVNAIARADGEVVRQIIRAGLGNRHQAGRVGDGRAPAKTGQARTIAAEPGGLDAAGHIDAIDI